MGGAKHLAMVRFADDRIAGGKIEQHGRPRQRGARRRRDGNPKIFANLGVNREVRDILRDEQNIRAKGRRAARDKDLLIRDKGARGEMAALIEFAVIGQVGFRRHGEDLAAQNEDRAIIEPLAMTQRRADDDQEV